MTEDIAFGPFDDLDLITPEFEFSTEKDAMDQLYGAFARGKKLIGFISYSVNHEDKKIELGFMEVLNKQEGVGQKLLTNFINTIIRPNYSLYRIELIAGSYDGKEFFYHMLRKNILPLGTNIIDSFPKW